MRIARWPIPLLFLVTVLAHPMPARAAPEDPPVQDNESPEQEAKRRRLELTERREKLPESARAAMALVDEFHDRDFRVWSSLRNRVVALGLESLPALSIGLDELDWETRAFAASCLAEIGAPASAASLADAYHAESRYTEARRQYVLALGRLQAASSKDVLREAAAETDPGVRLAAVRALGRFEDPALADVLRPFAHVTDDLDLRYEALGALLAIGDEEARKTLLDEAKALVADRKARRGPSDVVQDNGDRYAHYLLGLALARGSGKAVDKVLLGALLARKPWDNKSFLRLGAAAGLGLRAQASGDFHPEAKKGISNKDARVRIACTYAAGFVASPDLVPKLLKALGDSQLDVRHHAVMALGRTGGKAAIKGLRKALGDSAGEIRIGAVRALSRIPDESATAALLGGVRDEKYMIRVMAAHALRERTTAPGVLAALKKLTKDADYGVRGQALAALAHHPDGEAVVDVIAAGLQDRDLGVQANACLGLAAVADVTPSLPANAPVAAVVVARYLGARQEKLRRAAEEFLDAVRPPPAVLPLIAGLDHASEETRTRANRALKLIGETSQNFDPKASPDERAAAINRWKEWWAGRDGRLPPRGSRLRAAITGSLVDVAKDLKWKGLDIALLFDSTGSMAGLIRAAKERVDEIIAELGTLLPSLRVSVYTYRDFGDDFVFWGSPLTYDTWKLPGFLQNATHGQGGDLPEAVYDTCKNAMDNLHWRENAHKVIVYAGDAPHHPEQHARFIAEIKAFCTLKNQAALHAVFTDTNRRSLDIKARKVRLDPSSITAPFFERYSETAEAGRGRAVMLDDESALIKELLVLTFGEAWRADIENLLEFEY